ncbi:alpha/beta fold hydrolase [Rhodococcus pyridinivorans]|uniref:alpha/beta fold hydrolase n=1 Tax=Rhodococcus pyridinivorans TaxID=103816 RepID=UPI0009FAEBC8|nr:alpha/beta fold hydrolase [Rhodococcus pyridinivorans]UPW05090.1 alpha/beta fold hydrolase [Rhodococcus pyridinivorans]
MNTVQVVTSVGSGRRLGRFGRPRRTAWEVVVHIESRDGTTIGFRKLGQGPGLVVVHSSIATGDEWSRMASALADRFTVHLVDRRGRGLSGDADAYSIDTEIADIAAVLDAAGPDASLVGHSYIDGHGPDVTRYASVTTPTLFLQGSRTAQHHLVATEALRVMPDTRLVEFAGHEYFAQVTTPTPVADAIAGFLTAVR